MKMWLLIMRWEEGQEKGLDGSGARIIISMLMKNKRESKTWRRKKRNYWRTTTNLLDIEFLNCMLPFRSLLDEKKRGQPFCFNSSNDLCWRDKVLLQRLNRLLPGGERVQLQTMLQFFYYSNNIPPVSITMFRLSGRFPLFQKVLSR